MGVLGVGTMGQQHSQNILRLIPEARLIAVADADLERARQVAAQLEIDHYYDAWMRWPNAGDIRAIAVVTPAKFHCAAIKSCAQAGRTAEK